jgi:hypothetical protein
MQRQMIVSAYVDSQCTEFAQLGEPADFLKSFHLKLCIWPDAISRWIREQVCIKCCANLGRSATETLALIRQAFGEETKLIEVERGETDEEHAHNFFRGNIHKEFVLAGQTVNYAYYCVVLQLHENM